MDLIPETLEMLSDDQLWELVDKPFDAAQDARLRKLTMRGKQGRLSSEQEAEMETLLEALDDWVLRRSQALLLLKRRGHDVMQRLKSAIRPLK